MKVTSTALAEVFVVELTVHRDDHGFFVESYRPPRYRAASVDVTLVRDNHSRSVGTLRGLHWQTGAHRQVKLVCLLAGEILDVAVDIGETSPTFCRWVTVTLSADNVRQLFVPVGLAHGFLVLSEQADIEYKCADVHDPASERGVIWNDPGLAIDWPLHNPILSRHDRAHPPLATLRA